MTRRMTLTGLLLVALLLPLAPTSAQLMAAATDLYFTPAWTAPTVAGEDLPNYVALSITNPGGEAVQLTGVSSPAADEALLVQTTRDGDTLTAEALEALVIEPGQTVALEPGAAMIALNNPVEPLAAGDAISLALLFTALDNAGEVMGEPFTSIIGVAVLEEAPAESPFVVIMPWVRPTVAEGEMPGMGGMGHGAMATPEATAEGMHGMGGMGHGGMAMGDGGVSGAFMRLLNTGEADDVLVGVMTSAASIVEIHETSMVDNVMQMRPLESGLPLPVGIETALEPGGFHIMLINLAQPLAPGDAVLMTLMFESGAELTLAVPVYDALMMMMMGM